MITDMKLVKLHPEHLREILPVFERARQALAEAKTTDEVKLIRDQAQAIQAYLHQQRAGLEMQNDAAEIKLRAERLLGEMLAKMVTHEGGRPKLSHDGIVSNGQLPEGITLNQSSRWQTIATLPDAAFELLIAERKAAHQELTSAFMLRAARQGRSLDGWVPLPEGMYDVIYADPPWPYGNQIESWGPTSLHYKSLSVEDICAMAIPAASDATLFLWVTNPFLPVGIEDVMDSWGFVYKTNIVWLKTNRKRPGSGFYVRGHHELLLIGTKGSHVPLQTGREPISSVLAAPVQEHSRKPVEAYEVIESMYPDAQRLELFARPPFRQGWTTWGDENVE